MKWFQRQQVEIELPPGVSQKDAELLSAYLDGQLSQSEKQRLEQQLGERPALQTLLDELRLTRTLLRSQPLLRAPRNFTLTPQMAGLMRKSPARSNSFAALRLASVLATIFFVIVLAGDLFASQLQPAMMPASGAPQMAMPFGKGGGGGGGGADDTGSVEAPQPDLHLEAAVTDTPEAMPLAVPQVMVTPEVERRALEPTPTPEQMLGMAPPAPESAAEVAPTEAPAASPSEGETVQQMTAPEQPQFLRWALRLLWILLGLLALGTGVAAFRLRRRGWG